MKDIRNTINGIVRCYTCNKVYNKINITGKVIYELYNLIDEILIENIVTPILNDIVK
jgi:hypothetical protein